MPVKPNAKTMQIKEQFIDDPVTGLAYQFEIIEGSDAPYRLRIFGLPDCANREFLFNESGEEAGAGTAFVGQDRPGWVRLVEGGS